ncbi:DinB family protein [Winogradskyella ouciana]|uniref:DinB family protein n=1 Tax=Winogradskyella ouciana TaxID=2608631 RepID=UPI003D2B4B97
MMISETINIKEYNPYYKAYIDKASDVDILKGLKSSFDSVIDFYSKLPYEKHDYAYAEDKWTIKDTLLHIIDTERVFSYRALRISRGDKTPLAGFEQDGYVVSGNAKKRSLENLIEEYKSVRLATISLFQSFDRETLLKMGEASGFPISVRALGYIIVGHENHHIQVIKQRYL